MLKVLKGLSISVVACALLLLGAYGYFFVTGSILPNVSINGINVGFQTQRQAAAMLSSKTSGFGSQTITVLTKNKKMTLSVSDVASISDVNSVTSLAYQFGRSGSFLDNFTSFFDITLNGRTLPLEVNVDETTLREKISELAESSMIAPVPRQYVIKDGQLLIDSGKPGTSIDIEKTIAAIKEKIETFDWSNFSVPYTEVAAPPIDLQQAWNAVTTQPVDAYYDVTTKQVVPAVDGVSFDLEAAKASINLGSQETQSIPLTYTPADIQADDLIALLFQDTLGTFTTYFNQSSNRGTNIVLCAESINDTVIEPGEVFSFNNTRTEATPENGYKKAGVFENGKTVQGYGGGVCQVSSTLYAASLYANMETVERHNHMFTVSYMDISMDATVYYPTLDFQFRNTSPYPVKVVTETKGGTLTISIVGTKTEDEVEVALTPKRVKGSDGYKHGELWKTVTINGESTTTKENSSRYKG